MAITEVYVDPAIAANSGSGTIGDPYGDLQHALNTKTRDSTNGDRFNIKAGTDEILSSALSLATYGTPALGAPLIFQGYTSAAGDGGKGGISGNGSVSIWNSSTLDIVYFVDLHLHSCGSANIVLGDDGIIIANCEIDNTTGDGINIDFHSHILNCHLHNIGGYAIVIDQGVVANCFFANGANTMSNGIGKTATNVASVFRDNIFSLSSTSNAMDIAVGATGDRVSISGNSFYTTGTGKGIVCTADTGGELYDVVNNVFEGWGTAIDLATAAGSLSFISKNAFYNNTATISGAGKVTLQADNETLGASPFAKVGSATSYSNRATFFQPVNTGNMFSPYGGMGGAKGAVQPSGGGGGLTIARRKFTHFHY